MRNIYRLSCGPLGANSYVVTENDSDCVLIDCGDAEKIADFLKDKKLNCKALLLTHAHFDHCGDALLLQRRDVRIYLHPLDVELINGVGNLAQLMGEKFLPFVPDISVNDGDLLDLCGMKIQVIHTPGHTAGSVCYIVDDKIIFSGDTVFRMSVGRTDFPSGNANDMSRSLKRLFALKKDYKIYPGHDEPTTLFFERDNSIYV